MLHCAMARTSPAGRRLFSRHSGILRQYGRSMTLHGTVRDAGRTDWELAVHLATLASRTAWSTARSAALTGLPSDFDHVRLSPRKWDSAIGAGIFSNGAIDEHVSQLLRGEPAAEQAPTPAE
jgi:hypothetical protein